MKGCGEGFFFFSRGACGYTLTFLFSLSLSLVVPLSLTISHPQRVSLSGFHGDPVAVVLLLLRRKRRVHERGRKEGCSFEV